MEKVKLYLWSYRYAILATILGLVAIIGGIAYYNHTQDTEPKIITTTTLKDRDQLADELNVSKPVAKDVQNAIKGGPPPVATYYEQAPDVQTAAKQTQKAIKNGDERLPKVALAKTDRTAVVPNEEQQKVDVYKINLEKNHKILGGATVIDNKAYGTVGYQQDRFQILGHFDAGGLVGATATYTIAQW